MLLKFKPPPMSLTSGVLAAQRLLLATSFFAIVRLAGNNFRNLRFFGAIENHCLVRYFARLRFGTGLINQLLPSNNVAAIGSIAVI